MKRTRDEKNAPSGLERGVLATIKQLREQVTPAGRPVTENDVLIIMAGLPGRQGHPAAVRAALDRLELHGLLAVGNAGTIVLYDREACAARDRKKMVQMLAEKHGGVLFEDGVWCFLGAEGADTFAAAVRLEGLEVKRWRDDMADKAQVVGA